MRDWLVQEIIAEHGRLIAIMGGQAAPDSNHMFLLLWTVVKPGIASAVINVRARLPAGRGVQIKNQINMFGAAPVDQLVQQLETIRVIALKQVVMQGHPNRIESGSMQQGDVLMRNVVPSVFPPEYL